MPDTLTIFRVETPDQTGPYSNLGYEGVHQCPPYDGYRHPAPFEDGMTAFSARHFGFETIKQLCAWFSPSDCERLSREGYHVAIYKVSHAHKNVTLGGHQVAFDRTCAEYIGDWSLLTAHIGQA